MGVKRRPDHPRKVFGCVFFFFFPWWGKRLVLFPARTLCAHSRVYLPLSVSFSFVQSSDAPGVQGDVVNAFPEAEVSLHAASAAFVGAFTAVAAADLGGVCWALGGPRFRWQRCAGLAGFLA